MPGINHCFLVLLDTNLKTFDLQVARFMETEDLNRYRPDFCRWLSFQGSERFSEKRTFSEGNLVPRFRIVEPFPFNFESISLSASSETNLDFTEDCRVTKCESHSEFD
jgi:hypothetical protein